MLEVNGVSIDQLSHEEVAALITSDPNTVRLLVVDHDADVYFTQKQITLTGHMQHCIEPITGPETKPEGMLT